MKVLVNDACIACGACESVCDAVFSVEDKAIVNEAAIAGNEDCVKEAADCCPVNAIELEQLKFINKKERQKYLSFFML